MRWVPEVQYYLVGGLAVYGSTGLAFVVANKAIEPEGGGTSENATGYTIAALAKLGLDYAVNPDWNARIGVAYRQGLKKAELENESKTLSVEGGTLSAAEGSVALGYTF